MKWQEDRRAALEEEVLGMETDHALWREVVLRKGEGERSKTRD